MNPIIAIDDLYRTVVYVHVYVCESINCEMYENSQIVTNRYIILRYCLEGFYAIQLEDRRALSRIPSEARVLLSPEVF